jgi:putative protein kinase ArgK-like GTPase of G3E family
MGNLIRNYGPFGCFFIRNDTWVLQPIRKDMLDFADLVAINKFDKRGSLDALRDVKKQYQRNHNLWDVNLDTLRFWDHCFAVQ